MHKAPTRKDSKISTMLPIDLVADTQQIYRPDIILPIQNTRGINQAYLRPLPSGPLLMPGESAEDWQLLIQNEFRSAFTTFEDAETWRLHYTRIIATEGGEWHISLPLIHRGGGVFDPFINWWHQNIANHFDADREATSYGNYTYRLHDGTRISSGTGIGDLTLAYSLRLPGQPQISLKLPTGNPNYLFGSGGIDLGISAQKTWRLIPKFDFTAHASLVYQSPSSLWNSTHPWAPNYTLALAYNQVKSQSWILQYTAESTPVDNHQPYLDQTNGIVTLAFSQATKNGTWTYWLSEDGDIGEFNINQNVNVGADFAIGIRFSQKK